MSLFHENGPKNGEHSSVSEQEAKAQADRLISAAFEEHKISLQGADAVAALDSLLQILADHHNKGCGSIGRMRITCDSDSTGRVTLYSRITNCNGAYDISEHSHLNLPAVTGVLDQLLARGLPANNENRSEPAEASCSFQITRHSPRNEFEYIYDFEAVERQRTPYAIGKLTDIYLQVRTSFSAFGRDPTLDDTYAFKWPPSPTEPNHVGDALKAMDVIVSALSKGSADRIVFTPSAAILSVHRVNGWIDRIDIGAGENNSQSPESKVPGVDALCRELEALIRGTSKPTDKSGRVLRRCPDKIERWIDWRRISKLPRGMPAPNNAYDPRHAKVTHKYVLRMSRDNRRSAGTSIFNEQELDLSLEGSNSSVAPVAKDRKTNSTDFDQTLDNKLKKVEAIVRTHLGRVAYGIQLVERIERVHSAGGYLHLHMNVPGYTASKCAQNAKMLADKLEGPFKGQLVVMLHPPQARRPEDVWIKLYPTKQFLDAR